jgi:hypothetical protein
MTSAVKLLYFFQIISISGQEPGCGPVTDAYLSPRYNGCLAFTYKDCSGPFTFTVPLV